MSGEAGAEEAEVAWRTLYFQNVFFRVPPFHNQEELCDVVIEKLVWLMAKKKHWSIWECIPLINRKKNLGDNPTGCRGIYSLLASRNLSGRGAEHEFMGLVNLSKSEEP